ncbi:MAG: matrixin family metalloprotease [Mycobacteriales bacterium]|nr:matrixin family metalloprotease [Mycobacteriales bacterium]
MRLPLRPAALAALALFVAPLVHSTTGTDSAGAAVTAVAGSPTDYSFLATNQKDGSPARWNPCRAIHWRVNATGAPVDGGQHIEEALRRISAATGLVFVRDGRTSILPDGKTFLGWGTTDLVIGYATAQQRPALGGTVVGDGGAQLRWHTDGRWQIGKGYVLLDRVDLAKKPRGFGTGNTQGAVYLHELGHAVGLGHARALPQVMYGRGSASAVATWQRGDLAGLARLGRKAGCLTSSPA